MSTEPTHPVSAIQSLYVVYKKDDGNGATSPPPTPKFNFLD